MAGDEQALLYTLEEISGSDYALQSDPSGGSQVRTGRLHHTCYLNAELVKVFPCAIHNILLELCPAAAMKLVLVLASVRLLHPTAVHVYKRVHRPWTKHRSMTRF